MKRNFRTFKTGIVFGLVLISMFAVFIPNASAGFIKVKPLINVTYPTAEENIVPNSGVLIIPLSTTFTLTGIGASFVETGSLLTDTPVSIELKVESKEDWIDASIDNPLVSSKLTEKEPKISTLKITVTEKAPAFQLGSIRISATSKEQPGLLFTIAQDVAYFDVSFVVGYWPVVSYELPKGNRIETGPMGTAEFEINLVNMGNGATYVKIDPVLAKDGWSISIASSVNLASAVDSKDGNNKATVKLIIKPPYGFGFHNERQDFKVEFTPYYLGRPDLTGPVEPITFTVQSVGMSAGTGFEIPLIVAGLVVIILVIYMYNKRRK
jgi:hypothetical protein